MATSFALNPPPLPMRYERVERRRVVDPNVLYLARHAAGSRPGLKRSGQPGPRVEQEDVGDGVAEERAAVQERQPACGFTAQTRSHQDRVADEGAEQRPERRPKVRADPEKTGPVGSQTNAETTSPRDDDVPEPHEHRRALLDRVCAAAPRGSAR